MQFQTVTFDNPKLELAILRTPTDNTSTENLSQVESITNGWIDTAEELAKYLHDSESSDLITNKNVTLIIGKPSGNENAWFTCGCCGTGFKSNVKYQLSFDQDAGYGICPPCEHFYK